MVAFGGLALSSLAQLFFQGWIVGLSMSVPVGPVGMLCFRQVVFRGFIYGIAACLGVAFADAVFGMAAGIGMEFIGERFATYHAFCRPIGALFLLGMGIWAFLQSKKTPVESHMPVSIEEKPIKALFQAFFLTLANPMSLIGFSALFVVFGVDLTRHPNVSLSALVIGIFIGSLVSLSLFVLLISFFKNALEPIIFSRVFRFIFRIFGLAFFIFGALGLLFN